MFMASGGDDGLVKIWSCRPFVSAAHHTAQLTYGAMRNGGGGSARVTSLTVCDSSHSGARRAPDVTESQSQSFPSRQRSIIAGVTENKSR
jgi:hypothetical protein